jgi:hypothetical protein
LAQIAAIAGLISIVAQASFYAYEAAQTVLDIIRKIIPYRNYTLQYNSHAFYNTFRNVVNNDATSIGVKPSIIRTSTGKYSALYSRTNEIVCIDSAVPRCFLQG